MQKLIRSLLAVGALAGLAACGDNVSVTQPNDVIITGAPVAAIQVGAKVQLSANLAVTWASSAATVASVDATGLVTAVGAGTASITATSTANANKKASVTITVTAPTVRSVTVSPPAVVLNPGGTQGFVANVDADPGVARTVTWTTSSAAVATVSATGVVTAVAPGAATITATSTANPAVSGVAGVTVRVPTPPSVNISSVKTNVGDNVDVNNVAGQINVTVNLDPGDFTIQKLDLLLDGNVVGTQTFTAQQLETLRLAAVYPDVALAVSQIVFSINTAAFSATTGVPSFFNGSHTLSAKVTVSGGGSGGSATPSLALIFNNTSGIVISLSNTNGTDPASAINPGTGLAWIGGDVTIKAVGVSYVQGLSFATATIGSFLGKTTVLTLTSNIGSKTFVESTTWSSSNSGVGNYLSTGVESVSLSGTTMSDGSAGSTSVLNGTNAIPPVPAVRVDNTAPGVTSANAVSQTAITTTTSVIWVNASTSFAAGQLGIPSQSTLNASDVGADNVTVQVYVTPNGGTLPSGCSTTGLTLVTTGSQLTETTVSSAYIARVIYKDALGNISCSSLSSGTQFGADFTPPTGTVTGPGANSAFNVSPLSSPNFAVSATDNASGFSTTPLNVIMTRLNANGTTTCVLGSGSTCATPSAQALTFDATGGADTEGYYTTSITLLDQAGNQTVLFTGRLYLVDLTAPAFSGGISLPALIAGAATNTFVAAATDNLDLNAVFGVVDYPGASVNIQYPSQTLGAYGPPLETSAAVNYAVANWIRCINTAGSFTTAANPPNSITLTVSDQASNTGSLASAAFGANAQACTGSVGNIASTDINSFTQSAPVFASGKTQVDEDGSGLVSASATSVTLRSVADVALNSSADPFTRVDYYYQDPTSSNWIKIGTATVTLAQTISNRTYTYDFVWDPDASVPTGAIVVQAFGVDAQGDAVLSGTQTVTIVP